MYLKQNYIIIGNGIAGMTAAEEIRKSDPNAIIKIFTDENYLCYYRLQLSHSISKEVTPEKLIINDENWYRERDIEIFLNTRVKAIDPKNSRIYLNNNTSVRYDKLLLATGSSPFIPPIKGVDKKGVYTLRTIEDLQSLQDFLENCSEVAVIGGGLLGLEAAWALKERGLKVHVLEFFPYLLPRQLDEELAAHVKEKLEAEGLNIHLGTVSKEIQGDDKVTGIELEDGRNIPAHLVLLSTGVKSNIGFLEDSGIEINRGVVVDEYMKTNLDNIYAAGDLVEYNGVVLALWPNAIEQAKIAAKNMVGEKETFTPAQPATLLRIGKFSAYSVGEIKNTEESISYKEDDVFHKLFIENGKMIGGVLTGDIKKMSTLKKAVNSNQDISVLIEQNVNLIDILNSI